MDVAMLNEISDEVKKYNARLLPVIKGRKTGEISKVYNEGFREFGENRLEELLDHKSNFKDCHFHFIAPLQSRKIPEILRKFPGNVLNISRNSPEISWKFPDNSGHFQKFPGNFGKNLEISRNSQKFLGNS